MILPSPSAIFNYNYFILFFILFYIETEFEVTRIMDIDAKIIQRVIFLLFMMYVNRSKCIYMFLLCFDILLQSLKYKNSLRVCSTMSLYNLHRSFHQQLIHQDESDDEHQQQHGQSKIKQVHGFLMTFSWFFLLHIGIWAHYFRSYRYAILIHIICMSCIVLITTIACTVMITAQGKQVIYQSFLHQTIGFYLIVGLLPITIINGGLARIFMNTYKIQTMWMLTTKQLHKILGWIMLLLIKIPLATGLAHQQEIMAFIFMLDGISYGLFWYLKLNKPSVGVFIKQQFKRLQNVRKNIGSLNQYFNSLYGKCFIFANYVYPIQSVVNAHPGGTKFILKVRDRQIDRFIYGMELTQGQTCKLSYRHAHSANFLSLAQKPISKVQIQQPYFQLKQSNSVQIYSIYTSDNQKMFLIYLKIKSSGQQLQADGYRSFNQFGRYFALTFNGNTRLYTSVYFLLPTNIRWMHSLMNKNAKKYKKYRRQNLRKQQRIIQLQQNLLNSSSNTQELYIPLFAKRYDDGVVTSQLLTQFKQPEQSSMTMSQCRGFGIGLSFQQKDYKNQRVVMFAAGTGLNPYCDLIDILFKKMLIQRNEQNSDRIRKLCPILQRQTSFFNNRYVFYIGIESLQCIHPITLYQLQQLSNNDYIQCYLKSKNYQHSIKGDIKNKSQQKISHSSIRYLPLTYRFEQAIQKQFQMDKDVKLYICGTSGMIRNLLQKIRELQVPDTHFRIL